jgi:hypothetical protein
MQWLGDPPEEMDDEERQIIDLLKTLEKENS